MKSKAVAFMALLYAVSEVVDAYVAVNIYEKDVDKGALSNGLQNCNPVSYDVYCRPLGYIQGYCVAGECMCRTRQSEDVNTGVARLSDGLQTCISVSCDKFCRALGYIEGICAGGRCMCKWGQTEDMVSGETRLSVEVQSCDSAACDATCRALGYIEGRCAGDRCMCRWRQAEDVSAGRLADGGVGCILKSCDQLCRAIGRPGGVCVSDKCKCFKTQSHDSDIPSISEPAAEMENSVKKSKVKRESKGLTSMLDCGSWSCTLACKANGYSDGFCLFGSCLCY